MGILPLSYLSLYGDHATLMFIPHYNVLKLTWDRPRFDLGPPERKSSVPSTRLGVHEMMKIIENLIFQVKKG